jgi:RNA polymerase sigma-70 factor (ECF subfamily)
MSDYTSLSLLDRLCKKADEHSWEQLVAIYTPLVKSWIARCDVQPTDAEDLVQDVLMIVLHELPQFEHSGRTGAFRSWLRTILVHRVRDFWRSRKYRPTVAGGTTWMAKLKQLEDDSSEMSREWNLEHDRHLMAVLLESVRPRFEAKT